MRSQIHLIRHGITVGNINRWFYGASDVELAEEGIAELKEQVLQGIYPTAENSDFYTSGMTRTKQTFQLIYGDKEYEVLEDLQEMNFGVFEMKNYKELKGDPAFEAWMADREGHTIPEGGESILQFNDRVQRGFKTLMGKHRLKELSVRHNGKPATSTVVCHGGVISAIMQECFPDEHENFYKWIPDPGHGYTLTVENGEVVTYEKF